MLTQQLSGTIDKRLAQVLTKAMNKDLKPIRSKAEYYSALDDLKEVFAAAKGTEDYDRAEVLEILLEDYEEKNYPIASLDPIEAIKYSMEDSGLNQTELGEIIGDKSKASLVLNRKRKLSLSMIRRLHDQLKIPFDILLKDYPLASIVYFFATILAAFLIS